MFSITYLNFNTLFSNMDYPTHIAIIPDGCRRWAKQRNLLPWEGHKEGIKKLKALARWSIKNTPIKYYTVYGLSLENLNRSKAQLSALSKLYSAHFIRLAEDSDIHENKVNVDIVGREDLIPKGMLDAISTAREATKDYTEKYFRVALAYSGRQEVVDAAKKLSKAGEDFSTENLSKHLYSDAPDPDLIIRTAETRMSNFLLWESAYSELYFMDKYFPDVTIEDYKEALEDFSNRQRRFGK